MSQPQERTVFIVEHGDYPEDSQFLCVANSRKDAKRFTDKLFELCEEEGIGENLEEIRIKEVTLISGNNKDEIIDDILEKFVEDHSY